MPTKQSKNFTFTIFPTPTNNPDYEDWIAEGFASYVAYGEETCPSTGRFHHQGFLICKKKQSEFAVRKHIRGYAAVMRGNLLQNEAYCSKSSDLIEFGEKPNTGKRNDLLSAHQRVLAGELSINQILEQDPQLYHSYGRTLIAVQDAVVAKMTRTEMTAGMWLYGPTGCGKSHRARELAASVSPNEPYYFNPEDKGWWDLYAGQETVILDDFRGSISYSFLLRLVDKWPVSVPRRARPPIPFISKLVVVTSSLSPQECYHNLSVNDSLAQLMRRFEVILMDERPN